MKDQKKMESIRNGFAIFMYAVQAGWGHHEDITKYTAYLDKHPFGLENLPDCETFIFVAGPGVSDISQHALAVGISTALTDFSGKAIQRLRVITCPTPSYGKSAHSVFYEVESVGRTYICGGCNNVGGAGKAYKKSNYNMFEFLSHAYGVEIEETTLNSPKSERMEKKLYQEYERFKCY